MSVTYNTILRKDRPNSRGELAIIINVTVNRKIQPHPLGEKVHPTLWDVSKQRVSSKHPIAGLLNAKIDKKIAEIKATLLKEELNDNIITPDLVKRKLNTGTKKDFFSYCEGLIKEWRGVEVNGKYTGKKKKSTCDKLTHELSKIKEYSPHLRFSDITASWLGKYEAYLRQELKNQNNTVWRSFTHLRTFFNAAIKKKDVKHYPFDEYDNPVYKDPRRTHLTKRELDRFIDAVQNKPISPADMKVGWFFIFSCYTGLRYSDCEKFNPDEHIIESNRILLDMTKTDYDASILITPAVRESLHCIAPYIGQLPTDQECNRAVKVIADLAKIKKKLTFHCARHTFGYRCAEVNVPIEVAAKLMGHKDIKSTKVYYHISNENADKWMAKLHA